MALHMVALRDAQFLRSRGFTDAGFKRDDHASLMGA
jgi:hypothetical protein